MTELPLDCTTDPCKTAILPPTPPTEHFHPVHSASKGQYAVRYFEVPTGDPVPATRYGHPGHRDLRQEVSGAPYTTGESRTQQVPARRLGVHDILNPLEPQPMDSRGGSGTLPPTIRPSDAEVPTSTPGSTPGPFQAARPFPTGQPASISLPGTPIGPITPLGGPSSERNSPTMAFPFPAVNNPRRKPSPNQPPRAMSLSHGPPPTRDSDTRRPPPLPSVSPAKRPYENEAIEESRSQFPGLHHHLPGVPTGPPSAMSTPGRSLSQPVIPSPGAHAPPPALPPGNTPGLQQPPGVPSQASYHPNVQSSRPFPSVAHLGEAASSWPEAMRRHGIGNALFGVESQQAMLDLPGSDTPILVEVDFSQASKKADEKRQRNAVASTRHRRKKKILQEENTKQLQELRDERRMMELKIEELTQQRDFYQNERNRLRELVAQTPSIRHLAAGQPSPNFQTSNCSRRIWPSSRGCPQQAACPVVAGCEGKRVAFFATDWTVSV